jgi:hypothetical protein
MVDRYKAGKLSFQQRPFVLASPWKFLRACASPHDDFPLSVAEIFGIDTIPKPDGLGPVQQTADIEQKSIDFGHRSMGIERHSIVFEAANTSPDIRPLRNQSAPSIRIDSNSSWSKFMKISIGMST